MTQTKHFRRECETIKLRIKLVRIRALRGPIWSFYFKNDRSPVRSDLFDKFYSIFSIRSIHNIKMLDRSTFGVNCGIAVQSDPVET